jgi:hypothetical protein
MPSIQPFPTTVEQQRRLQALAERRSAQRVSDIEHGKKALAAFKCVYRERLGVEVRATIARNLWHDIQEYQRSDNGTVTQLLEGTQIERNHLDRLILAPDKVGNNELHAYPPRYIALMESLTRRTNEDIYLLADRVLLGTHFHPESLADIQDAQLILESLQVAADQIDLEFKLWEQCQAVADIRKPLEEPYFLALKTGNKDALADFYKNHPSHVYGAAINLWWPIDDAFLWDYENDTDYAPINQFWAKPYDTNNSNAACVWSHEEIFFFPHIYLGPAIEWKGWVEFRDGFPQPTMSQSSKEDLLTKINAESEPLVEFNESTKNYQIYKVGSAPSEIRINGTDWDWGSDYMDEVARWLVIYPDPEAKRLIPCIFTHGEMFFTQLIPLSARLIVELGDSNRWQYLGHDAPTLLQRLRDLTGYGNGDFKIMEAWRETAARFHMNPIFKNHPGEAEKILYRRHLEKWIKEGRARLGHSSEDVE